MTRIDIFANINKSANHNTRGAKMRFLCFGIARSLIIIVNLLVVALACLFIYVSFTAFNQEYEIEAFSESQPRLVHDYVSLICAGLGAIIALLALLGLIGALGKSKSVLATYSAILFFLLLNLIVLVLLTYSLGSAGPASSYKEIDRSFVNSTVIVYNYVDSSDMKTRIIDNIQKSFACCGVNSPNDWTEYSLHKIPKSCCSHPVESSLPLFEYCAESDHKVGCWKVLNAHFHANLSSVRIVLYSLISVGLIFIAAALFMTKTLRATHDIA